MPRGLSQLATPKLSDLANTTISRKQLSLASQGDAVGTDATLLEPHRDATAPPPSAVVDSHPVGNYVNARLGNYVNEPASN